MRGDLTPSQLQYSGEQHCTLKELQVSDPSGYEYERDGPATPLPCGGMDKGEIPPLHSSPSTPVADERADPGVMRAGEMSLHIMDCSTWESKACISSGQLNRTDSDGSDVGELSLRSLEQESWSCHSLTAALGKVVLYLIWAAQQG